MRYLKRMTVLALSTCAVALARGSGERSEQAADDRDDHPRPAGRHLLGHHPQGRQRGGQKGQREADLPRRPDGDKEAQLIQNVIEQHVDGIALTLAFPDAEAPAVKAAQEAGIPIVGFNAGVERVEEPGPPGLCWPG